jgi:hypothetical protein
MMSARLIDWITRTVMLVLAGLVTLSILGAIAAIPSEPGAGGFLSEHVGERPSPRPQGGERAAPQPEPALRESNESVFVPEESPSAEATGTAAATAAPPRDIQARWLETIAYALLALAGLMALGLVLLGLATRQLRRIAEALESSAA